MLFESKKEWIEILSQWKKDIQTNNDRKAEVINKAEIENSWFTALETNRMLDAICNSYLDEKKLETWLDLYSFDNCSRPKKIAIISAGNIPLVCFHDLLCAIICDHEIQIKLSEKDQILPSWILDLLCSKNPSLKERITIVSRINDFDAVIATGSDIAGDQFKHYFGKYPNIIRTHRNAIAILDGNESLETILDLGKDIFYYYGLGCRNISKIFIPRDYNFIPLIKTLDDEFRYVRNHTKYFNNYEYNLAIYLLNKANFLQGDASLFIESEKMSSRIASIHFEYYDHSSQLVEKINSQKEKIQCVVSQQDFKEFNTVKPGSSQYPELNNYADDQDTMKFLTEDIYTQG